jgi:hypothetical protein
LPPGDEKRLDASSQAKAAGRGAFFITDLAGLEASQLSIASEMDQPGNCF